MVPLVRVIGISAGFFSGLLGLGGSLHMTPLFLYAPQWEHDCLRLLMEEVGPKVADLG